MSLLSTLLGRRPKFPPGAALFVDSGPDGQGYVVRMALAGQEHDLRCKRVGPAFTEFAEAARYRDAMTGGVAFQYPEGAA